MSTETLTAMRILQDMISKGVRSERPAGTDEVEEHNVGSVRVVEINNFPEETPDAIRADVHFLKLGLTEGAPTKEELIAAVRAALNEGVFANTNVEELAGGPSYITLGGWLGSQQMALMFIGLVELLGIAPAITPELLGMEGDMADEMAGMGFVMLGPSTEWAE
jgi:hypothetical protein